MLEKELLEPVKNWLAHRGLTTLDEVRLCESYCDVVGVHFVPRIGRPIPELRRSVAVELKLRDIAGVLSQAKDNQRYVDESYAAMPESTVQNMRGQTWDRFKKSSIGLIIVRGKTAYVVMQARINTELEWPERTKNKLWRRYMRKQKLSQTPDGKD